MDLGLKGKKAIVTGGTRGIGRAVCELLAADGCDVGLCARHQDQVGEAVAALEGMGVKATGGVLDVTEPGALATWIDTAAKDLGGVDILVANVSALAEDLGENGWRSAFETDVMGSVRAYDAALPT